MSPTTPSPNNSGGFNCSPAPVSPVSSTDKEKITKLYFVSTLLSVYSGNFKPTKTYYSQHFIDQNDAYKYMRTHAILLYNMHMEPKVNLQEKDLDNTINEDKGCDSFSIEEASKIIKIGSDRSKGIWSDTLSWALLSLE